MAEPNADDGLMPDIVWVVLFFFLLSLHFYRLTLFCHHRTDSAVQNGYENIY